MKSLLNEISQAYLNDDDDDSEGENDSEDDDSGDESQFNIFDTKFTPKKSLYTSR